MVKRVQVIFTEKGWYYETLLLENLTLLHNKCIYIWKVHVYLKRNKETDILKSTP